MLLILQAQFLSRGVSLKAFSKKQLYKKSAFLKMESQKSFLPILTHHKLRKNLEEVQKTFSFTGNKIIELTYNLKFSEAKSKDIFVISFKDQCLLRIN